MNYLDTVHQLFRNPFCIYTRSRQLDCDILDPVGIYLNVLSHIRLYLYVKNEINFEIKVLRIN